MSISVSINIIINIGISRPLWAPTAIQLDLFWLAAFKTKKKV